LDANPNTTPQQLVLRRIKAGRALTGLGESTVWSLVDSDVPMHLPAVNSLLIDLNTVERVLHERLHDSAMPTKDGAK